MTDNEAVLRDLLLEMGVRGAECITPFALACLADYMRERDNTNFEIGGGSLQRGRARNQWAMLRHYAARDYGFDIDRLHDSALELAAD